MTDDFERRLSIALRTAADAVDTSHAAVRAPGSTSGAGGARGRRPGRTLLAVGIVVVLAAFVGSAWWVVGRSDHRTAVPAGPPPTCRDADLRATPVTDPADATYRGFEVGSVGQACRLDTAPPVTVAGHPAPYLDPTGQPGGEGLPVLPVVVGGGRAAEFWVTAGKDAAAYACARGTGGRASGIVEVVLGGAVALSFGIDGGPACEFEHEVVLLKGTSAGWSTGEPADCTASDLSATWRGGGGIPPRGLVELADPDGRCVVRDQPAVAVDGRVAPYASVSGPLTWTPLLVTSLHPVDLWVNVYDVDGCSRADTATPLPGRMSVGGAEVVSFTLTLTPCEATAVAFGPRPDAPDLTPGQN